MGEWQKANRSTETRNIREGEPSFFDLSAKNATGSDIDFRKFEGYVTIVANVAKMCDKGITETGYTRYAKTQQIWPYTIAFVIFPFEHPEIDYEADADFCEHHDKAHKKEGRIINVMEETKINGPDSHPVYKYLKNLFEIDELGVDMPTFFLVTPDGDQIEMHQGSTEKDLRDYIYLHLQRDL